MSEKYISVDNLLQWIGERITCEALCSNPMKSDKGCDGNCILGEITPREKSIISVITESIKNAPAADVAEVVRCKDCRYADGVYVLDSEPRYILCSKHRICVKPRGYCSYGERKIDGEKEGV